MFASSESSQQSKMHSPPEVSVVLPVFNGEDVIGRALRSIQAQTFTDFEIIVVDDGSTDRTADSVADLANDRLTLIKHACNRGAAAARNTGITAARGRRIAFLDSDDTWNQEKLARQIELLERSPRTVKACATGYRLHKNGRELVFSLKLAPEQFRREILFGCMISPGSTLVVDRDVFDNIGMFDELFRRLEDWDWLLRFTRAYEMVFVPLPLADIYLARHRRPQEIERVNDALDRMRHKHLPDLSGLARMRLRGSLLVEKAAMFYRAGKPLRAATYVVATVSVYPFRNLAFFRTLWRSVKDLYGGD